MTDESTRLRALCICADCPSYNECMREKDELLFCTLVKSISCAFEKKGCICPACPVKVELHLMKAYYCIRGNEEEQESPA